jgi:ComF family protein
MRAINRLWQDFTALLFPRLCLACDQPLLSEEKYLCLNCDLLLPKTNLHLHAQNEITERFAGRIRIETAAALFYFSKAGKTQHLIHQIKYNDKREAAITLGFQYGQILSEMPHFQVFDTIIPVPLHPSKQILRGYNQAEMFAQGLSDSMMIAMDTKALIKTKKTDTQTHKSRLERLQNVEEAYELKSTAALKGKNILIVDDVMTTGATLEACVEPILAKYPEVKIGFVTIALAT